MAWSCTECGFAVKDELGVCPECGYTKTAWTVIAGVTRAFTLSRKRFEVLRGTLQRALAPDDPALGALELVEATHAPVMSKARAQALADQGKVPPPAKVLFVSFKAKREEEVAVEVLYASRPSEELALSVPYPEPPPEADVLYAKLLCVSGPEELSPGLFEGITLVDVSEEDGASYAPELEVSALRKEPRSLPTRLARRRFRFSF